MSDLIDKLNMLVRSRVNSVLGGGGSGFDARRDDPDKPINLNELEREIREMRKHIEDALNTEDEMQRKLEEATAQAVAFDQQADAALANGEDDTARQFVQQYQKAQRSAETLASELDLHRRATSQLIEQVNKLEAVVADRKANTQNEPQQTTIKITPADEERINIPIQRETALPKPPDSLPVAPATPIKIGVKPAGSGIDIPEPTIQEKIKDEVDKAKIEDDLAARRKRLS
jgi:chromosome segregation ATPase